MKVTPSILLCGLVLVFSGCVNEGDVGVSYSYAIVRAIHGEALLAQNNQPLSQLRPNMALGAGATVQTEGESSVILQVNGAVHGLVTCEHDCHFENDGSLRARA